MGAVLYLVSVSHVKDDGGHRLSSSVLIAIIVVFLLFILLILGFTLVWCLRSGRHSESPVADTTTNTMTTANFVGTTPISLPHPAWIPLRAYRPRQDHPEIRGSIV
ncbi:hypothetical protein DFS33DRAFT_1385818 [Desarmillaria ectypa]|nr:hypothetical protein DFS33DRAFT_1385818 [Desarmillaria ectypa]